MRTVPQVIVRIMGGVGNQLFQYAVARRLALFSNAELVIDDISGFLHDQQFHRQSQLKHFNISARQATSAERMEPFPRLQRYIRQRYNCQRPYEHRTYIHQEGMDFDDRILRLRAKGRLYLEGYWQSEDYFKDANLIIRDDLYINPPMDGPNLQMAQRIRNELSVAVHVRFFEELHPASSYPQVANNVLCDYYERAFSHLEQRFTKAHYFVFSDRPHMVKSRLRFPESRFTLVSHNQGDAMAFADLWLMTQCHHFIIANSTFSWWGAWLAQSPKKIVIAPAFKTQTNLGAWGFSGLLPLDWVTL